MIVELKNVFLWRLAEKLPDFFEEFFKEHGKWEFIVKNEKIKKKVNGDEFEVEEERYEYNFKYIGEISAVPVEILNSKKVEIDFYHSGMRVMSERTGLSYDKIQESRNNITIHMPHNDLLSINHVDWLEDSCTEEVQRKLDNGFRIIACIPQVGSRRPDYILGKMKTE